MSENLSAESFKGESKTLSIDNIIASRELQSREDLDYVKQFTPEIVEALKAKDDIDPIFVIEIDEGTNRIVDGAPIKAGYYVAEGFRRLAGYKAAGRDKIPCVVRKGSWEDAVDVSTSANIKNLALPRTRDDKRRATWNSLVNHFDLSDRQHAEHVKVSAELVAKVRPDALKYLRTFAKESPNGQPDTKTRVGKSGKRQAAHKKKTKKAKTFIDWSTWEGPYGSLVLFVDHVGEMTLDAEERKNKATDYQKAMTILSGFAKLMKRWSGKKPKVVA